MADTFYTDWYKVEYDPDSGLWDIWSLDADDNCGVIIDSYNRLENALEHAKHYDIHGHGW